MVTFMARKVTEVDASPSSESVLRQSCEASNMNEAKFDVEGRIVTMVVGRD